MYKLCKTEQSAIRQRQLEEGMLRAMETVPYEELTISDLCQQLGIPRKSFYRYFSDKDGALHALLDHTLMEYQSFNSDSFVMDGRTMEMDMERFFQFWKSKKGLLDALERSNLSGLLIERAIAYAVSDEVYPGCILPGESREMQNHVVVFATCGLLSMVFRWHSEDFRQGPKEMGQAAVRLLSRPLFPGFRGNL
ncbi:MAG: TetR/AcrR family transcriptional regulator [Faecousia sp.]